MSNASLSAYHLNLRLFLSLLLVLFLLPVSGSCETLRNYQIKAGFTYRFLLFSEWPSTVADSPSELLTVGVIGQTSFNRYFEEIPDLQVGGRKVVVLELSANPSAKMLHSCQVLFIPSSHSDEVQSILEKLEGAPVLTISDVEGFLEKGGMIEFFTRRNRIRFAVHRQRAGDVGITFRAQMLKMATQVVEDEQ